MKTFDKIIRLFCQFFLYTFYLLPEIIMIWGYIAVRQAFHFNDFTLERDGIVFLLLTIWPCYLIGQALKKRRERNRPYYRGRAPLSANNFEPPMRKTEWFYGDGKLQVAEPDNYGNYRTDSGKTYRPTWGGGHTSKK